MGKKFDVSYTDTRVGGRYRRGLKLSRKGARKEVERLKKDPIFRSLNLVGGKNPRIYRRKK